MFVAIMHHEEVRRDLDLVVLEMGFQIEPTPQA